MKTTFRIGSRLAALLLAAGLGACSNNADSVSYGSIAGDLTPELRATSMRPVDRNNAIAMYTNKNWRSFWDDIGRTFYTDAPSRLSPYPINNTTGQPR